MVNSVTTHNSPFINNESKLSQKQITKQAQETQENQRVNDKVSKIKQSVENGTYKSDVQKTSEKMALNLLNL